MGIYSRYSAAFLILALLTPKAFSAVRVPVIQNDEYIRQVLSKQTASTGAISTPAGQVAFFGADKVFAFNAGDSVRPTVREVKSTVGTPSFPYGPGAAYPNDPNLTPAAATKVKVRPQVVVPKSNILSALKNGIKSNPAQLMLSGTVAAAVGAVGWVMSPDNTQIQMRQDVPGSYTPTSGQYAWALYNVNGNPGAGYASPEIACAVLNSMDPSKPHEAIPTTDPTRFNCSNSTWWTTRYGSSCPSGLTYNSTLGTCVGTQLVPLTDSALTALDPWVNQQSAEWLGGLIRDVCNGSLNPGNCYSQMVDRSKGMIQGPALLAGPITTKTTQVPNPDGTTSTRTETTKTDFKLTYGKDYFDVETEKKTTVTQDGQLVSETTEKDDTPPQDNADTTPGDEQAEEPEYTFTDSEFPDVTPFYEQKYPDGLSGVWSQAKADIDNSNFMRFLSSFIPSSFTSSCPTFGMSFAIGNMANFGAQDFNTLCYIFDFIKVIFLVTAVFTARALTFGG